MSLIYVNDNAISDLHVHSSESDGWYTPREILAAVKQTKLKYLAFADHHTLGGYRKNVHYAEKIGIELIPAVEIATDSRQHIIGYGMSDLVKMEKSLKSIAISPETMFLNYAQILRDELDVFLDESLIQDTIAASEFNGKLDKKLSMLGYKEAYDFVASSQKHVNGTILHTDEEIIKLITSCGGVACFAHPHRHELKGVSKMLPHRKIMEVWDEMLEKQRKLGLRAIEITPSCDAKQRHFLESLAKNHNLLKLGGTDFHGWNGSAEIGNPRLKTSTIHQLKCAIYSSNKAVESKRIG